MSIRYHRARFNPLAHRVYPDEAGAGWGERFFHGDLFSMDTTGLRRELDALRLRDLLCGDAQPSWWLVQRAEAILAEVEHRGNRA